MVHWEPDEALTPEHREVLYLRYYEGLSRQYCAAALGIAALDGRILECNTEFQTLLGFPRDDLLKQLDPERAKEEKEQEEKPKRQKRSSARRTSRRLRGHTRAPATAAARTLSMSVC